MFSFRAGKPVHSGQDYSATRKGNKKKARKKGDEKTVNLTQKQFTANMLNLFEICGERNCTEHSEKFEEVASTRLNRSLF